MKPSCHSKIPSFRKFFGGARDFPRAERSAERSACAGAGLGCVESVRGRRNTRLNRGTEIFFICTGLAVCRCRSAGEWVGGLGTGGRAQTARVSKRKATRCGALRCVASRRVRLSASPPRACAHPSANTTALCSVRRGRAARGGQRRQPMNMESRSMPVAPHSRHRRRPRPTQALHFLRGARPTRVEPLPSQMTHSHEPKPPHILHLRGRPPRDSRRAVPPNVKTASAATPAETWLTSGRAVACMAGVWEAGAEGRERRGVGRSGATGGRCKSGRQRRTARASRGARGGRRLRSAGCSGRERDVGRLCARVRALARTSGSAGMCGCNEAGAAGDTCTAAVGGAAAAGARTWTRVGMAPPHDVPRRGSRGEL